MANIQPDWNRFWKQWTPKERKKLENNTAFMEAHNADNLQKAQDIAITVTQPAINDPKKAKAYRVLQQLLAYIEHCQKAGSMPDVNKLQQIIGRMPK